MDSASKICKIHFIPALIKSPNSSGEYLIKYRPIKKCSPGTTPATTTPSAVNELCEQILEKDRGLQSNQDDVDKVTQSPDFQVYSTLCKSETEDWGLTRGK